MDGILVTRSEVFVPISLLYTTELTASEKLVWAGLALDSDEKWQPRSPQVRLAKTIGICRQTVATAQRKLEALGWYAAGKGLGLAKLAGRTIRVAVELLVATSLRPAARLTRMQLQAQLEVKLEAQLGAQAQQARQVHSRLQVQPQHCMQVQVPATEVAEEVLEEAHRGTLEFRYGPLSRQFGRGVKSLRSTVKQLQQAEWLDLSQTNRVAPVIVAARNPIQEHYEQMAADAELRLSRAKFLGEAIMREILSLIIDAATFVDDGSLGFLVNPRTREQMRLDRYYMDEKVGFEFNGYQHYRVTELYDQQTVDRQRERDATNRELCAKNGVALVVVHPQDLSVSTMLQKVGNLLPLRSLVGAGPLIRFLDRAAADYQLRSPVVIPF